MFIRTPSASRSLVHLESQLAILSTLAVASFLSSPDLVCSCDCLGRNGDDRKQQSGAFFVFINVDVKSYAHRNCDIYEEKQHSGALFSTLHKFLPNHQNTHTHTHTPQLSVCLQKRFSFSSSPSQPLPQQELFKKRESFESDSQ